jgi:AcrR family transcriptional regulator
MGRALTRSEFEDSRDAIVGAAISIIARDGAPTLTLRGLAEEAGCNRQTPYRFFRGKETILAEAYLHCHKIFITYCEEAARGLTDPYEQLVAIRSAYLKFAQDEPDAYLVAFEMDPPLDDERVVKQRLYARDSLRRVFEAAHAQGLIEDDPNHMAYLYWSNLHMMAVAQKADKYGGDLDLQLLSSLVDKMFFKRVRTTDQGSYRQVGSEEPSHQDPRSERGRGER